MKPIEIVFNKMLKGTKVELNEKGKEEFKKYCTDRWFYISSINADETVNLCSSYHYIIDSISLDLIKY